MKNLRILILVIVAATIFYGVCSLNAQRPTTSSQPAWEYKALTIYEVANIKSFAELYAEDDEESKDGPKPEPEKETSDDSGETNEAMGFNGELFGMAMKMQAHKRIVKGLDKLGADGWELVAIEEGSFVFKRQRK